MSYINFSGPINPLSFGNVSYNMLRALHKKGEKVCFFPIGNKIDLTAFNSTTEDFQSWLHESYEKRLENLSPNNKSIKMWHLNGSESRVGRNQDLYTLSKQFSSYLWISLLISNINKITNLVFSLIVKFSPSYYKRYIYIYSRKPKKLKTQNLLLEKKLKE